MRERLKKLWVRLRFRLIDWGLLARRGIFYIGGSDTLPPPLERAEEAELIARMDAGDESVRGTLIERNLRLVAYIARRFENTGINIEDLISIGTIGLIKGINTYRPDKGVRLATYASKCTENEILMHFRSARKNAAELSLSDAIDTDGDGNTLSLMDILAEEEDLDERLQHSETCRALRQYIDTSLDPREADIIRMRYGLSGGKPLTQREVAESCGISRSYVSRIEKRAIEKLREAFGEDT